jgi:hypothetical protein
LAAGEAAAAHLRKEARGLGGVGAHEREHPDALAVESEVLGEGLGEGKGHALIDKVAKREHL